jgi:tRNA(adenine34) deaminase
MVSTHFLFMQKALDEARLCLPLKEVPVGCIIVHEDRVIARAGNRTKSLKDPTAHAEIIALRQASTFLGSAILNTCDLYVTLEPCAMCAGALAWARLRHVYFGAYDPKSGGVDHGARVFDHPTCHHKPLVTGGLLDTQGGDLLRTFFQEKRRHGHH